MSVNDAIKDDVIDHAAMVRLLEERLQKDIDGIFVRYQSRLKSAVVNGRNTRDVIRRADREVRRLIDRSYGMLSQELRTFISMEADFHTDLLDREVGDIWRTRNTPKTPLRNLIATQPLRDSRVLAEHFRDIGAGERMRITSAIRRGIASGTPIEEIASGISTKRIAQHQARAIVRTAITQYGTSAALDIYDSNEGLLKGYQYVATLDSRTTPICSRNDGRVFRLDDPNAPRPPLHWNCRSTTVPVTKAFADIDGDQVKKGAYDNASPRMRASINGQVPVVENYGTWLMRQPYEVQLRHLGDATRVDIFKQGNLKLRQFTNPAGRFISLEVLRRLNAYATQRRNPDQALLRIACDSPCKNFNDPDDFEIAVPARVPLTPEDFYDSVDAKALTTAAIRKLQAEYNVPASKFNDIDYKGRTSDSRRRNRNRFQNDVSYQDGFYDEFGQWQSSYLQNVSRIDEVEADILRLIADDDLLTDADKEWLTQFFARSELLVGKTAALASLSAWRSTFRTLRGNKDNSVAQGKNTIDDLWKANLIKTNTGAIDDISKRLVATSTRGERDLESLRRDTIALNGGDRVPIPDIIKEYPDSLRRVDDFVFPSRPSARAFEYVRDRTHLPEILKGVTQKQIQDALTEALRTGSSDWTTLAVRVGRQLYRERGPEVFPGRTDVGTPMQYWEAGDLILDGLADSGFVNKIVLSSKKSRQLDEEFLQSGTNSITTRESITWNENTVNRHIRDQQIISVRDSLGYDDTAFDLTARRGDVFYRDAEGNLTNIPLRSRGKQQEHNEIGPKTAEALNAKNQREYRVEEDGIAGFVEKLLRTSTAEGGRTRLNFIQQSVKNRGEQNSAVTLRYQLERLRNDPDAYWTNRNFVHEGGRSQAAGYLSDNSGEFWRPVFVSKDPVRIGEMGFRQLQERLAVLYDKTTLNNQRLREDFFDNNVEDILSLGKIVDDIAKSPVAEPRRLIRQLEDHRLYAHFADDPNEIMQFVSLAREVHLIRNQVGNNNFLKKRGQQRVLDRIYDYESRLLPELDAAESGQGVIAILTKDKATASKTNVISQGENRRLRRVIAEEVYNDPYVRNNFPWITIKQLEKIGKDQITTSGYGSKAFQRMLRIIGDREDNRLFSDNPTLQTLFRERPDAVILDSKTDKRYREVLDKVLDDPSLSDADRRTVRQIRRELDYTSNNGVLTERDLLAIDRYLDPEAREVVRFITQNQGNIATYTQMRRLSEIFNEKLVGQLPKVDQYSNFVGDLFQVVARNNNGRVLVRTADGDLQTFEYLSKERVGFKRIIFTPDGPREVFVEMNVFKDGSIDLSKARSSGSAAFTHANDAVIARLHALRGRGNVYDGFTDNLGNLDELLDDTVGYYIDILEDNTIEKWLTLLRDRKQISEEEYDEFLTRYRQELEGDLSRDDILNDERSYLVD